MRKFSPAHRKQKKRIIGSKSKLDHRTEEALAHKTGGSDGRRRIGTRQRHFAGWNSSVVEASDFGAPRTKEAPWQVAGNGGDGYDDDDTTQCENMIHMTRRQRRRYGHHLDDFHFIIQLHHASRITVSTYQWNSRTKYRKLNLHNVPQKVSNYSQFTTWFQEIPAYSRRPHWHLKLTVKYFRCHFHGTKWKMKHFNLKNSIAIEREEHVYSRLEVSQRVGVCV